MIIRQKHSLTVLAFGKHLAGHVVCRPVSLVFTSRVHVVPTFDLCIRIYFSLVTICHVYHIIMYLYLRLLSICFNYYLPPIQDITSIPSQETRLDTTSRL